MKRFTITMVVHANDAEHAQEIISEVMQGAEDARDSGELKGGDVAFEEFSLREET